mgnify:CR=1 FL=1
MPATTLRITLDRALGEHAFLLGEVMRTAIADAPDLEAAGAAVESNSEALIGAMEGVYGPEASARFGELWRDHVGYVLDYARAVANGDAEEPTLMGRTGGRGEGEMIELGAEPTRVAVELAAPAAAATCATPAAPSRARAAVRQ